MSYRTKVFHQPVTEPVPHQQVIKSTEFRAICKMITDNNLLWTGRKPRRTYRQVRTLFSEATDGLDINDYWTCIGPQWDNPVNRTFASRNINSMRVIYIKKGQKCCVGNARHDKLMPHRGPCRRDIQNKEPWKMTVSQYVSCGLCNEY